MKSYFKLIPVLSVLAFLHMTACVPTYVPNTVNMPLFTNKGEVQGTLYSGSSGIDPQASIAISNHVGIMVNASFANRTSDTTSNNFHKHNFVELGSGYYQRFGNKGVFEIYGGYGIGNLEAQYDDGFFFDYEKVNSERVFIQPTVGFTGDVFDAGFAPRIVYVKLTQGSQSNTGVFYEPTFTGKVGFRQFRFVFQVGLSFPFSDQQVNFNYQPFIISMGLQGNFGRKYPDL